MHLEIVRNAIKRLKFDSNPELFESLRHFVIFCKILCVSKTFLKPEIPKNLQESRKTNLLPPKTTSKAFYISRNAFIWLANCTESGRVRDKERRSQGQSMKCVRKRKENFARRLQPMRSPLLLQTLVASPRNLIMRTSNTLIMNHKTFFKCASALAKMHFSKKIRSDENLCIKSLINFLLFFATTTQTQSELANMHFKTFKIFFAPR